MFRQIITIAYKFLMNPARRFFRSDRSKELSVSIPLGTLPVGINYQARVEVHDSDNYSTLNNRSNGENLNLDTIVIPFAGVTNLNTGEGLKTQLDLGINVDPSEVSSAYVNGPGGFYSDFQGKTIFKLSANISRCSKIHQRSAIIYSQCN